MEIQGSIGSLTCGCSLLKGKEDISIGFILVKLQGIREFSENRPNCSMIYYLIKDAEVSAFHSLRQEEVWQYIRGSILVQHRIHTDGTYEIIRIGHSEGEIMNTVGCWHATERKQDSFYNFSLIVCVVAPSFEYENFCMPSYGDLLEKFPQHQEIIRKFNSN